MKIFNFIIILFLLILNFSESHAQLTHTQDPNTIDIGNGGFRAAKSTSPILTDSEGEAMVRDQWQDPTGAVFNNDGTKFFAINRDVTHTKCILMTTLTVPYDLNSQSLVQDSVNPISTHAGVDEGDDDSKCEDMNFNNDGTKMYIVARSGKVFQFSLATPYDFSNITFDTGTGEDLVATNDFMGDIEFNNDGTKLFYLDGWKNDATLTEFSLSTPYDIRTKTTK